MLDPDEMKKGGFGAFAAKERERKAARDAAAPGGDDARPSTQPEPQSQRLRADKTTTRP